MTGDLLTGDFVSGDLVSGDLVTGIGNADRLGPVTEDDRGTPASTWAAWERRFPALDLAASGTMRPELLVGDAGADAIATARAETL